MVYKAFLDEKRSTIFGSLMKSIHYQRCLTGFLVELPFLRFKKYIYSSPLLRSGSGFYIYDLLGFFFQSRVLTLYGCL